MKTSPDCLACMMRQVLKASRLASRDEAVQRRIVQRGADMLANMDWTVSPPENVIPIYRMISDESGCPDPFAELKDQGNRFALAVRDHAAQRIRRSGDPFLTALRFAVCGNIIDHAAQHRFEIEDCLLDCENRPFLINHSAVLRNHLTSPRNNRQLLYLADNCGEIVFDGLFIEELQQLGWRVTLAVRGGWIINDATRDDVLACGLDRLCPVIDSGVACPGTPLHLCSDSLRNQFAAAECIISKGMGNFETLSENQGPLFFLFTVKCPVVARHIAENYAIPQEQISGQGDMVLLAGKDTSWTRP